MNEATTQLLNTMASKLGVATEMLWNCLLRQAPVTSTLDLTVMFAVIGLTVFLARKKPWQDIGSLDTLVPMMQFFLLIVCVAVVFRIWVQLPVILSGFFNPEYWALHQLLQK